MREAGYTSLVANTPQNLTNSKGWRDLLEKYVPEKHLMKVHKEGLGATVKKPHLIDRDSKGRPVYEYVDEVDYSVRHKYLETAYRIRGRLQTELEEPQQPIQVNIINVLGKVYGGETT
jgi:hypothetical protein